VRKFTAQLITITITFLPLSFVRSLNAQSQQTSISNKEKKAQQEVIRQVETLRLQKGLPRLSEIEDRHLREDACESAKRGKGTGLFFLPGSKNVMVPSGIFGDVGNLSTISYMASDPSQPSTELSNWAALSSYQGSEPHRFGVGVCFANTPQYPEGTYWVDVGYYMSGFKTFLYRVTFMWD
jgi:hypothetical protein